MDRLTQRQTARRFLRYLCFSHTYQAMLHQFYYSRVRRSNVLGLCVCVYVCVLFGLQLSSVLTYKVYFRNAGKFSEYFSQSRVSRSLDQGQGHRNKRSNERKILNSTYIGRWPTFHWKAICYYIALHCTVTKLCENTMFSTIKMDICYKYGLSFALNSIMYSFAIRCSKSLPQ